MNNGFRPVANLFLISSAAFFLSDCASDRRSPSRQLPLRPATEKDAAERTERPIATTPHASREWTNWAEAHRIRTRPGLEAESAAVADISTMIWNELGPRNIAGRAISLAFRDPAHPRSIVAGSAGGGIWASEDLGASWRQLGGDRLASLWIGALAVDPTNPDRIYAGTGEGNTRNQGTGGAESILKSEDGGEHFRAITVPHAGAFFKIVVSTSDPSVVIAASNIGIHRSNDRGETWTTTGSCPSTDLIEDASRPGRYLAACGEISIGIGALVESTDAGLTWHRLGTGLPPPTSWGRSALAIVREPAKTLFLWIGVLRTNSSGHSQLYRSLDDGATWLPVEGATTGSYQSYYGNHLKVLGTAEGQRLLHADGYQIFAGESPGTIDASTAWGRVGGNWHVDSHGLEFSEFNRDLWIAATDGGVAASTDGGRTFFRADQGFPTVQYYTCAFGGADSASLLAGAQDNGLHADRADPGGAFDLAAWVRFGGDVFALGVAPSDRDDILARLNGPVLHSVDGGRSWTEMQTDFETDSIVISLARSPSDARLFYFGGQRLHVTADGGATWRAIDIRPGADFNWIESLAVSSADERVIWTLWEDGKVFRSEDAGATWSERSPPAQISGVKLAAGLDANSAYAIVDAPLTAIYRTHDSGASWVKISGSLPPIAAETIFVDPRAPGRLFTGLETGAAFSQDDGDNWFALDAGLPRAVVRDFCLDPIQGRFVAATYGRGLWELKPPEPCTPNATTLCLLNGRFSVSVDWKNQHSSGEHGAGTAVADTDQSGRFWFFSPDSIELVVKMIDGRAVNHAFWVFDGALSDVEYTIKVRDNETGESRSYYNAPGNICGGADTSAFPDDGSASALRTASLTPAKSAGPASTPETSAACSPTASDLCLLGGRFKLSVAWKNQHSAGQTGSGTTIPSTDQTGYFWFFSPDSFELAVKMIDGRGVNGHFWVFFGALSDVEYTITVTDTQTGAVKTFHNDPGNICGGADTSAFADAG